MAFGGTVAKTVTCRNVRDIDVGNFHRLCVSIGGIEGIAKIHEESVAFPSETRLDVRV